jgi:hypothetical protein
MHGNSNNDHGGDLPAMPVSRLFDDFKPRTLLGLGRNGVDKRPQGICRSSPLADDLPMSSLATRSSTIDRMGPVDFGNEYGFGLIHQGTGNDSMNSFIRGRPFSV